MGKGGRVGGGTLSAHEHDTNPFCFLFFSSCFFFNSQIVLLSFFFPDNIACFGFTAARRWVVFLEGWGGSRAWEKFAAGVGFATQLVHLHGGETIFFLFFLGI